MERYTRRQHALGSNLKLVLDELSRSFDDHEAWWEKRFADLECNRSPRDCSTTTTHQILARSTPCFAPTALLSCPLERSTPWSENELCGVATLVGGGSNDGEAPHFGLLSVEATMAGGGKAGLVGRRSVLNRGEAQEV